MKQNKDTLLIKRFNRKDVLAFGEVYSSLYKELFIFTSKLLVGSSLDANDILHDIFVKLIENKTQQFESLDNVKAYMYVCIRNYVYNLFDKDKTKARYNEYLYEDDDYLLSRITEVEIFSLIHECEKLLPIECAKVFKLHLDGYSIKEIADILGKGVTTIYTQKQDAISILKKRLPKDKFYLLTLIMVRF